MTKHISAYESNSVHGDAGITVHSLYYWASCFKTVTHPQFPSSRVYSCYANGCEETAQMYA